MTKRERQQEVYHAEQFYHMLLDLQVKSQNPKMYAHIIRHTAKKLLALYAKSFK